MNAIPLAFILQVHICNNILSNVSLSRNLTLPTQELMLRPFVGCPLDICKLRKPAANFSIEVYMCSTY